MPVINLPKRIKRLLIYVLLFVANILLLMSIPPIRWITLWPQPAIWLIVIGVVVIVGMQHRPRWNKTTRLRIAGAMLIFVCEIYAWHSVEIAGRLPTLVSVLHAAAVLWINAVIALGVFNQMRPKDQRGAPLPEELPEIAAVIPTYGEPVEVLEPVIRTLMALDYPSEKLHVYVSDDGRREEVAALAKQYGAIYQQGPGKDAKAGNLNSALELIHQVQPNCDLVLTQDADEVIDPQFLRKVVGYFSDPRLAFVQTPKECVVPDSDPFGNRDRVFYDSVQVGRNGVNAAFACGSGVMWRISAVEQVGGFNTWNLVEDMTTSYELHSAGFRSAYHNEIMTVGLSPDDIPGLLKQRGTWAIDTWRMFLFMNPLLKRGKLKPFQRLQYLELGLFYCTSAFVFPLLFLVPVISLLTGDFLRVEASILLPWLIINALYHVILSNGSVMYAWRYWQYWISHTPTYQKAFWAAVRSRKRKPSYVVTRKTRLGGFHGKLLWVQFSMIALACVSVVFGVVRYSAGSPVFVLMNAAIVLYYSLLISGICAASFYGVTLRQLPVIGQIVQLKERLGQRLNRSVPAGRD